MIKSKRKTTLFVLGILFAIVSFLSLLVPFIAKADNNQEESKVSYADMFVQKSNVLATEDITAGSYSVKANGVDFKMTGISSSFYFAKKVNLNNLSKIDNLFTFQAYCNDNGSYISAVRIHMIDAYDESNKISFYFWQHPSWPQLSYFLVEHGTVSKGRSNETWMYGQARELYGSLIGGYSFNNQTLGSRSLFNAQYDMDENIIYTVGAQNIQGAYNVLDLDSLVDMGSSTKTFKGFSTGEVYFKFELSGQKDCGIIVTSIGGESLSGKLPADYTNDTYFDVEIPKDGLTDAVKNMEYVMPHLYNENDVTESVDVSLKIEKNGVDHTQYYANGKFIPRESGDYTLTYSAKDNLGRLIVKTYPLTVLEKLPAISITYKQPEIFIDENFKFQYSIEGGTLLNETITYSINDKVLEQDNEGYVFIGENGELNIIIKVEDYSGIQRKFVYNFAIRNDKVSFIYDYIPEVVRSGNFEFPTVQAYDYANNEYVPVDFYINDVKMTGNYFNVTNESALELKIVAMEGTAREISEEFHIKVVQSTTDMLDLFRVQGDSVEVDLISNGLYFNSSNDITVKAPYALSAQTFKVSLNVPEWRENYKELFVRMTDANNHEEAVLLTVYKDSEGYKITDGSSSFAVLNTTSNVFVCDKHATYFEEYAGKPFTTIAFAFDSFSNCLKTTMGGDLLDIEKYENGKAFKGFSSDIILVEIGIKGVEGESGFGINYLANQYFEDFIQENFKNGDNAPPELWLSSAFDNQVVAKGSVVVVPYAKAFDALSYGASVTLEIISNGSKIYTMQSPNEEYELKLEEYGMYNVRYILTDVNGIKCTINYNIESKDLVKPNINILGEYRQYYTLGSTTTILNYQVTDDHSEIQFKLVYIVDAKGTISVVEAGQEYYFMYEGVYTISYYAIDSANNEYVITKTFEVVQK